ncbi:MAG: recombinase family protein [Acidimicrobiales bacterium]
MSDVPTLTLAEIGEALGSIEAHRRARRAAATANFGPRGFGHVHDRSQLVQHEAEAIREAARRVLAGETLSSVVQDWNRRGLRTTTGGPWRVNSLSALLIQPRLAGLDTNEPEARERWPAVIDRSVHERLVALRSSRTLQRRLPRRSLLNGLLRCGRCKGPLHYLFRTEANQYYRCPAPAAGGCSGVIVKARLVEDHLRDLVIARVDSAEFLSAVPDDALDPEPARVEPGAGLDALVDEIHGDLGRLRELAGLWAAKQITRAEWQQARTDIARRLERNEATLRQVEAARAVRNLAGTGREVRAGWSTTPVDDKRELLRALLDHVIVEPVGGTGGKFRPERLQPVWRA